MIEKFRVKTINTFCFLPLVGSIILVLQVTSCKCNNSGKGKGPRGKNKQGIERTTNKPDAALKLEINHELTTNQVKVIVRNQGSAIANIQLYYANISLDDKGKTALLDGKSTHTLSVDNIPASDLKAGALPIDFREGRASKFTFQMRQEGLEVATVEKTFQKPMPEVRLALRSNNAVGGHELPLYYSITQESNNIPLDYTKLSLEVKSLGFSEENSIFYDNQKVTTLQFPGTQLTEVGAGMNRMPITLGPSTTSASISLQLSYEGVPLGEPKSFSWQASHNGPTKALFDTIFTGNFNKTKEILLTNPNLIHATDEKGNTALHQALKNKKIDKDLIQLLLDRGAKLDTQNKGFYVQDQLLWGTDTPLHEALKNENITPAIIKLLLDKEPNLISVKNETGDSILHTAASNPKMTQEMIDLLIAKGADTSDTNKYGMLPVMRAVSGGNRQTFKWLFEKTLGINPNSTNRNGNSLLQLATWADNTEVVESLLSMPGIKGNPMVTWGTKKVTLLYDSIKSSRKSRIIELLLQTPGSNVNFQDEKGNTCLHAAIEEYILSPSPNKLANVEVLLKNQANKNLPNSRGITPMQLVEASTHEELKTLFK